MSTAAVLPEPQGAVRSEDASLREAYHEMVRSFGEVAAALSEQGDLDALLHKIAERICGLTGVPRCSVYLRDEKTELFRGAVGHPASPEGDQMVKRLVAGGEADRFTQEIVTTQKPVLIANAMDDPRPIRATMRFWNIRSMLGVPMVLRGDVIGIVFLDAEHEHFAFPESAIELASSFADLAAAAIVQARLTADLRQSLGTVARQNQLLRRAAAVDDRLGNLSLQGASFSEIAEAVADLTAKPCAIYDHGFRVLARAVPSWLDEADSPRFPNTAFWAEPRVVDALAEATERNKGIVGRMSDVGLDHRLLIAPVLWREHQWGMLAIMECGTPLAALDRHIVRRAATTVALEHSAEHRAAQSEWDARAGLLGQLVRGHHDVDSIERRAQYLGIDLERPRVLCLFGSAERGAGLPSLSSLVEALGVDATDQHLIACIDDEILVALELDPGQPPRAAVEQARRGLEAVLARHGHASLVVALSTACTSRAAFGRAFGEAQQVLSCLTSVATLDAARTLTADELGPARLLLASTNREDAQCFAHGVLGGILSGGHAMADLLDTLYVFFESSRSVRRSAHMLGVHENTIRYRLARVEEITGLCVATSSEDQLTVQFALLILRICGEVHAPERVGDGPADVNGPATADGLGAEAGVQAC